MKSGLNSVLCFGDSNTWGYIPLVGGRYPVEQRWTSLLEQMLPDNWRVINEGLPGRTTGFHESIHNPHSGLGYFLPCLEKHQPDVVVIMLGTNDLQSHLELSAQDISLGAAQLVKQAQHFANHHNGKPTDIVLICPPPIYQVGFAATGFDGAEEKSKQFAEHFEQRAQELGCYYINAGEFVTSSPDEGVHWHQDQPAKFAQGLFEQIKHLFI
ncbi:SGNH/GDSL hydrolase family protein [Vibrio panuliri]|uniref:Lipolytic protein n=1 Tax=Vibrio panuliri TaxID=1381081 RepID=A0A1Q9HQ91_9VIBR|nr:SGNH/GDSL hydrolase family protein [Vibrio panuliri]KAB1457904.1 SGNH/GDSL hydrolase family protein [Vibrio panuliri]OLQ93028.1 lipolytic protein [Vibrio panuliri]OLQ95604.1 lipolytic protein [Vibrio panuliri]